MDGLKSLKIMPGLEAPARTRSPAQAAAASNCGRRRSAASEGARLGLRVGAPPRPDLSRSPSRGATHLRSAAPLVAISSWPIGSAQRRALGAAQSLSRTPTGGAPEALGAPSSQLQSGRPHARPPHTVAARYYVAFFVSPLGLSHTTLGTLGPPGWVAPNPMTAVLWRYSTRRC
jgi:hypothetical protein